MIHKVIVENFYGIKKLKTPEFGEINLIIGENDTGKTGILKLLYGFVKALEIYSRKSGNEEVSYKKILGEKLFDVFQPKDGLGDLVSKGIKEMLRIELNFWGGNYKQDINCNFGKNATKTIIDCSENILTVQETTQETFNTIFIPVKEVLTAFKAIKFTREQHYLTGFDDTYLDLIKALEVPTSKGNIHQFFTEANHILSELFEGEIKQIDRGTTFIFKKGNAEFSMALTAEGIKNIGILTTLIRNRQLSKNTVLFLDEPETALHPKAIRQLIEIIIDLAVEGVQVFMTTHNYFVIKQLSIWARKLKTSILCCSLERNKNEIEAKFSDLKDGLPENPIVDEALKMFDEELELDLKA